MISTKPSAVSGTTLHGGTDYSGCDGNGYVGCGTVFELATTGNETVLYRFCSEASCKDGAGPCARLIMDGKGNLYSTTYNGGASGVGTVFMVNNKTSKETVLYSFAGGTSDAANPHGSLVRSGAGNLFGTTIVRRYLWCWSCIRAYPSRSHDYRNHIFAQPVAGQPVGDVYGHHFIESTHPRRRSSNVLR